MDVATKQRLGTQARVAAVQRLFALHRSELDALIEEERVSRGLTPNQDMESAEAIRAKLEKKEAERQRLLERLAEAEAYERKPTTGGRKQKARS